MDQRASSKSIIVKNSYDQLASIYDRKWKKYISSTLGRVVDTLALKGDERLLDVPCGTGELERMLLSNHAELCITAVDLSREMLRQAIAKASASRVSWVQANVEALPLAEKSFDVIICANGFHYFPSPDKALLELRRVLAPGGKLLLIDWCHDYLACKLCALWLRYRDPAFHRSYSSHSCHALLESMGFEVIGMDKFRAGWIWGMMQFICRVAPSHC